MSLIQYEYSYEMIMLMIKNVSKSLFQIFVTTHFEMNKYNRIEACNHYGLTSKIKFILKLKYLIL